MCKQLSICLQSALPCTDNVFLFLGPMCMVSKMFTATVELDIAVYSMSKGMFTHHLIGIALC